MKITTKFLASSVVTSGLIIAVITGSNWLLRREQEKAEQYRTDSVATIQQMAALEKSLRDEIIAVDEFLFIQKTPDVQDRYQQASNQFLQQLESAEFTPSERLTRKATLGVIRLKHQALTEKINQLLKSNTRNPAVFRQQMERVTQLRREIEQGLNTLIAMTEQDNVRQQQRLTRLRSLVEILQGSMTAIVIAIFMLQYRLIFRPVVDNVQRLKDGAASLGRGGNLSYRIGVNSRDELGELAQEFNRMADYVQEAYQSLEKTVEERTKKISETNRYLEQEIYERLQMEGKLQQALETSERAQTLLQRVIDATPDWIFVKDRQFRYLLANRGFATDAHRQPQEIIGRDDLELGFGEDLVFGDPDRGILGFRHDDERVLGGEAIHNPYDPANTAEGKLKIFDTQKLPLYDEQGEVFAVLGFSRDITERHEAEDLVRTSQAELLALFAAMQDVVLVLDRQGHYLKIAETNAPDRHRPPASWTHKTLGETLPPQIVPPMLGAIGQALDHQAVHKLEYHLPIDEEEVWFEATVIPFDQESVLWVARDISDRRQAAIQLQNQAQELEEAIRELRYTQGQMVQSEKMSSLGQLVAGIAHEINNPVNFIYGNIQHACDYCNDLIEVLSLYQDTFPDPGEAITETMETIDLDFLVDDFPKLMTSMRTGAERIREIVLSLRTFSRLDEAEMKQVNIHEGIDSTLMILHNRIKVKSDHPGIEVIKDYGPIPDIECYAGQLNQVFMNILSNAIDALEEKDRQRSPEAIQTQPSRIHIQTLLLREEPQEKVLIRFRDNGPGMNAETLTKIFDPFYTTKAVGKGTGLGMSISHSIIVEKHNGTLECYSQPGQGAEFVITIPLHQRTKV